MTVTWLTPSPKQRFVDSNGNALVGGKLFTYMGATTPNTKIATYTDSTGVTANPNPIILDSRGECQIWLTAGVSYKYVLSPASDTDPPTNPFWTVDNIMVQLPIYWPSLPPTGHPGNSAFLWGDYIVGTVSFPANFAGSRFYCHTPPTATCVVTINQNGSAIGTITFAASSNVGVLATVGGLVVNAVDGDRIEMVAQASADATITGIYGTLKGTRLF